MSGRPAWNQIVGDDIDSTLVLIGNRRQQTKRAESRRLAWIRIIREDIDFCGWSAPEWRRVIVHGGRGTCIGGKCRGASMISRADAADELTEEAE